MGVAERLAASAIGRGWFSWCLPIHDFDETASMLDTPAARTPPTVPSSRKVGNMSCAGFEVSGFTSGRVFDESFDASFEAFA